MAAASTGVFPNVHNIGGREHPHHQDNIQLWDFLLASWRGGLGMAFRMGLSEQQIKTINANGYYPGLFKFKREAACDYVNRVAMSPYTPLARQIVEEYVRYVTKDDPERESAEKYTDFIENADLSGRPMDLFTRDVLALAMVMGEVAVLVDMPQAPGEVLSVADAKAKGQRAYANIILPQNIVDWALRPDGKYEWLIIENTALVSTIDSDGTEEVVTRTYWDANVWQTWTKTSDAKGTGNNSNWVVGLRGNHPCKETPVIRIVTNDIDQNALTPESWFFDLADMNRSVYNLNSLKLASLYYQTFGILVLPDVEDDTITNVSRSHALTENLDTKNITRFVQTDSTGIESFKAAIDDIKVDMFMTAGLQYQTGKAVPESGISKSWDFQRVNQFLAGLAKTAEFIEVNVSRLVGCWEGIGDGYAAVYPKDYAVDEIADIIEAVLGIQTIGFSSETGRKEALKHLYRKVFDFSEETYAKIEAEIDESETPSIGIMDDGRLPGDNTGGSDEDE